MDNGAAMSVLGELKRRKMFQVAVVYLVVAWLIMQIVDVIFTPLRLPEWFPTVVIVFLAIGFPIAMIISWAFNVTPGGLVRDAGGEESAKTSGRTIEFVLIGLVAVAVLWLIYRTEFDAPPAEQPLAQEVVPNVLPNSVAVLPFANLSPDPNNAYFAAGIHDTILHELAKVSDLNVVSRTVMLRYAKENTPIRQIAEELNVQSVMEGSVQYAGGRVLVTAQLIDPQTNLHLWSENYDRDFSDIFAIQSEIATRIAEAMQAQLSPEERQRIEVQMTESPEAYALYLRAMDLADWDFSPTDSTDEIHSLLDEAIALDPRFARAYSAKANIYAFKRHELALAMEYATKALALDANLGSAYAAMAMAHARSTRDEEALDAFETALGLGPNDINILDDFSRFLATIGNYERSLEIARRVLELDPGRLGYMAVRQLIAGDLESGLATIRQAVAVSPENHSIRVNAALLELLSGNPIASAREAKIASKLRQNESLVLTEIAQFAHRYGVLGMDEDAAELYDLFIEQASQQPEGTDDPGLWVRACLGIGDYDCALDYLILTAEQVGDGFKSPHSRSLAFNVYHQPELERPEFVELRKQLGYEVPGL